MRKKLLFTLLSSLLTLNIAFGQTPLTEAVDFTVTTVEGETLNLFDILGEGKHVLIDFFFTTCGPCQQTAPLINEAYVSFGCNAGDVFFIAMDNGDTDAQCIQFDQTFGVEYPTVSGVEGGGNQVNVDYGISLYPTVILIAPNHDIIEQDIWPIPNAGAVIAPILEAGCQQMECPSNIEAAFTSDITELCPEGAVSFTDQSMGDITNWEWTFEGGEPASSTEQNPVVTYNIPGMFDVELTVYSGSASNTMMLEDYLTVYELPEVTLDPYEDVCLTWPAFELTGGLPEGGEYTGTGVTDGWFDPQVAGIGTHTITYIYDDEFGCINQAERQILVDPCTSIDEVSNHGFEICPNPTSGEILLQVQLTGNINITVSDIVGTVVYESNELSNGQFSKSIDLSRMNSGIYFVSLITSDSKITEKIQVLK
ncbi:MAG: T9SS type A sorting domain-containing protein [Bacteroidales bacterium]|nr:T9SS type A sorting domain-containing protein [Bacteroidales bacterium]